VVEPRGLHERREQVDLARPRQPLGQPRPEGPVGPGGEKKVPATIFTQGTAPPIDLTKMVAGTFFTISFDLPADVEEQLRRDHANLDGLAKEAALVELYRQGSITQHQLAESLDKTRFEIDELLKQHNVTKDLVTAEEVAEQVATLRRLLGS
jgi:predicted HTH domain antitoxin